MQFVTETWLARTLGLPEHGAGTAHVGGPDAIIVETWISGLLTTRLGYSISCSVPEWTARFGSRWLHPSNLRPGAAMLLLPAVCKFPRV